jgi:hypothetical protein
MKNKLFQIAMDNVRDLTIRINSEKTDFNTPTNKWCKIVPDSDFSPLVKNTRENEHIIYFPENSIEYTHKAENFSKKATIKSGTILENNSGRIYNKGDEFLIPPNTEVCPVSVGGEAFAIVEYVKG